LAHLKDLRELKELTLTDTKVDDACMVYLRALDSLTRLDLLYTRVTAEGIGQLEGHPSLKHVGVSRAMMTRQQSEALNKLMAPIRIEHYAN
jgi:hypothetical protein